MKPSQFQELTYEVDQGVAVVTLTRPERGNLWSGPMAVEYRWALHHADQSAEVRVVVLTGAGGTFCAGADVDELNALGDGNGAYEKERVTLPPHPADAPPGLRHNHTAPLAIGAPVIAAVEGACAGAGFVLATYADLMIGQEEQSMQRGKGDLSELYRAADTWTVGTANGAKSANGSRNGP